MTTSYTRIYTTRLLTAVFCFAAVGCGKHAESSLSTTVAQENAPTAESYKVETIKQMQGTWIHSDDSLAVVNIQDDKWNFEYLGTETEEHFDINLSDSIPSFATDAEESIFLVLTNRYDSMNYEILTLSDSVMSLMNFPRGKMHVYRRSKTE
jgi:hypothetical protein